MGRRHWCGTICFLGPDTALSIGTETASQGIYYVSNNAVSVSKNADPVFKRADFLVGGAVYRDWQMLRILRNTEDGVTGHGVVTDSPEHISVMLAALEYERNLFKTGARRGFLKSVNKLTKDALAELKAAVKRLFSNSSPETLVVLNNGVEFQAMGQTAVDAQLEENKASNGREVCKLFCLSPKLFEGGATAEDRRTSAAGLDYPDCQRTPVSAKSILP